MRLQKSILFVEDDDDLRFVMQCTLEAMGYPVVACADAQQAAAAFRSVSGIALLLTGFEMPGKTGLELARELTSLQPSLPVVILTGSMLLSGAMKEIQDRRWTYMSKPYLPSELEAVLMRTILEPCQTAA